MCVVNLTLGLFIVFVFCDGLYLTVAYSIMRRSSRSGQRNIERIDRFWSTIVDAEGDTPPPVTMTIKSKKSISFVPLLATLEPPPLHDSSNTFVAVDQVTEEAVVDTVAVKSRSRNSGRSRSNNSSSIGELMMTHNRLFLESLKLRKEAIETVLADPRITSLTSSSTDNCNNDSNSNSGSDVCVSLDIEDRWLQLRDSIGMTRATFKLYASQYPTLAVDILTTPVKVRYYSFYAV